MEEPGRLQSMGSQRVGHDQMTKLSFFLADTEGHSRSAQTTWAQILAFSPVPGTSLLSLPEPQIQVHTRLLGCSVASMEMKGVPFKP